MKRKVPFMMILNLKKNFDLFNIYFSALTLSSLNLLLSSSSTILQFKPQIDVANRLVVDEDDLK